MAGPGAAAGRQRAAVWHAEGRRVRLRSRAVRDARPGGAVGRPQQVISQGYGPGSLFYYRVNTFSKTLFFKVALLVNTNSKNSKRIV